ncbi:serine protease [Streptomyces sp. NPDC101490]|uniref:serine protease n=1 Tax=Streptomyces sp. NPDC101490 TaxID=3366143 RepID=UPI003809CC2B
MGREDLATLVSICDPAGRPRGAGFLADHHGTVVTSHEAVEGLCRVLLRAPGGRSWLAEPEAVTRLPERALALVRTRGLDVRPLPLATRGGIEPGTYVRIAAHGWREARVLGPAAVTYAAADRCHPLGDALELAIGTDGAEALRPGGQATGGPVLDTATGTVFAVLGTALRGERPAAGYAVPLRPGGALTALLRRNAATVPAYGPDLNLAAVLELTATSTGPARDPDLWPEPVERGDCVREFARFTAGDVPVLALVGAPGTGRTTALAALCARRARGVAPAPTVRLRGADLRADDRSLADAVGRALRQAGRIVTASGATGDTGTATPERAAALARDAGRPLLVLLDGPEEMPPLLAHRLADWTSATEHWLRAHRVHLVTACRPEHWEQAGALYTPGALHRPVTGPGGGLPAAVALGPYSPSEARAVREGYGLAASDLAEADAHHPLALRLLAEVRAALPGEVPGRPGREEIFTAHLDLMCLRTAVRIAAGTRPLPGGAAVRRLAARVTGQVHEAARRCLGPGHGVLDRASFEELFPWREGWAPAVLTEGLLTPAGTGYRFAHEELGDWLQAAHLDVDGALTALLRPRPPTGPAAPTAGASSGASSSGPETPASPTGAAEAVGAAGATGAVRAVRATGAARATGSAGSGGSEGPATPLSPHGPGHPTGPAAPVPPFLSGEVPPGLAGPVLAPSGLGAPGSAPGSAAAPPGPYPGPVAPAPGPHSGPGAPASGPRSGPAALAPGPYSRPAAPAHGPHSGPPGAAHLTGPGGSVPHVVPGAVGPGTTSGASAHGTLPGAAESVFPAGAGHFTVPGAPVPHAARGTAAPGASAHGALSGAAESVFPAGAGYLPAPGAPVPGLAPGAFTSGLAPGAPGSGSSAGAGHFTGTGTGPAAPGTPSVPPGAGPRGLSGPSAPGVPAVCRSFADAVPGVPRQRTPAGAAPPPVPRHRIGPVLQALLLLHRQHGPEALAPRLTALADALHRFADDGPTTGDGPWWAARLFGEAVRALPDPRPYLPVLRLLADRIGARPGRPAAYAPFGPGFWLGLPLGEDERIDLLRRLVPADPPPGGPAEDGPSPAAGPRALDAVAGLLARDPRGVQPLLCRWFGDARPLPATPHATVATAAQALLHTHRALAADDLCEALVATAHPLAEDLLAALAEDEPGVVCRAVDRWAHDDGRPERRTAALTYGQLVVGHATTPADRELLRYAALALLARPADRALHGPALGLLVRDPLTRARHLPRALTEPRVPASALAAAMTADPGPVLAAFRIRLNGTGEAPAAALRALAEVEAPALARRAAALVRDYAARHPEGADLVAAFVDRRLEDGPAARAVLFPLTVDLIRSRPAARRALAPVLAAPGTGASRHLRTELLDVLLEHERYGTGGDTVLDALLTAAADHAGRRSGPRTRELVRRVGALWSRTPEGAGRFDRALAGLARERPGFAAALAAPADDGPPDGVPEPVREAGRPGTSMPMRTDGRGHGSLRPA